MDEYFNDPPDSYKNTSRDEAEEVPVSKPKTALERMQEKLYLKNAIFKKPKRSRLRTHRDSGQEGWEKTRDTSPEELRAQEVKRMSFAKKLFIASVLFFTVAGGAFFLVVLTGVTNLSSGKVNILVNGPVATDAGKEVGYQVIIENKNSVALESPRLVIHYPAGSRDPQKLENELVRVERTLDSIAADEVFQLNEKAVFFGQEGEKKEVRFALEYRLRGSNAIVESEKTYEIGISSSPLSLNVDILKEVNSGKEFEMTLTLVSNSNKVLNDILVHIEYPFGFSFVDATPSPAYGKSTWQIGDLPPQGERTISIKGVVEGQNSEEKVFRIESGVPRQGDEKSIGIVYTSSVEGVTIARPFLDVALLFEREEVGEIAARAGDSIFLEIAWTNNLPTKIVDAEIEAHLSGAALNKSSVNVTRGFYRSFDNTILWDQGTLSSLSEIQAGSGGKASFGLASNSLITPGGVLIDNPQITVVVNIKAKRISETGVPEEIENSAQGVIKIITDAHMSQRAVYFSGPFANTGPIPPRVEKETTYTVIWTVTNSANPLRGGIVTATLPPYVRFLGNVTPQTEEVAYIEDSRTVRWALGNIRRGTGVTSVAPPREIAFQVAFLPSISQLRQTPRIVSPAQFTATDEFTETSIRETSKDVTTHLTTDPQFERGQGAVVE